MLSLSMKCKVQTLWWEKVQGEDTTFSSLTSLKLNKIQWVWVTPDIRIQLWIQHPARYWRPRCQCSNCGSRLIWFHAVNTQLLSRFSSLGYRIWPAFYKHFCKCSNQSITIHSHSRNEGQILQTSCTAESSKMRSNLRQCWVFLL